MGTKKRGSDGESRQRASDDGGGIAGLTPVVGSQTGATQGERVGYCPACNAPPGRPCCADCELDDLTY